MNSPHLGYFLLLDTPENVKEAVTYGEWTGGAVNRAQLTGLKAGDILLFYPLQPVNGLVGFATIKDEPGRNDSSPKVEFERNFCLPRVLWVEQKIHFPPSNTARGIQPLQNREEIDRISKLTHLLWGIKLESQAKGQSLEVPLFYANRCVECGKQIDSRSAKYCTECRSIVRRRQISEWNKQNREKIREAGRRWRRNHPDKVREARRRWNQEQAGKPQKSKKGGKAKKQVTLTLESHKQSPHLRKGDMSRWCKQLRKDDEHLSWMRRHKSRREIIAQIERKFGRHWEDKFKEVFNNRRRKDAAKILDLNYDTLMKWAKHLKLRKTRRYLRKKQVTNKGNSDRESKPRDQFSHKRVIELLTLIDPTINTLSLSLNSHSIRGFLEDILSLLPTRQAWTIQQRYLGYDSEKRVTLEQLGQSLGITRERVRQLEQQAITHLSHPSNRKLIRQKLANLIFTGEPPFQSHLLKKITQLQEELDHISRELQIARKHKPVSPKPRSVNTPISEIALSVRARNCLDSIGLRNLGDLADKTESEMLAVKNLGKKTLRELSWCLSDHGLKFNQSRHLEIGHEQKPASPEAAGANTTLSEIRLSARARKCLDSMGFRNLGELAEKTESDMLAMTNLGPGTLRELSWRLSDHGLKFKQS